MTYKPQFERLFRQWQDHDLARYRPEFYKKLQANDEIRVWEFIETNYLLKYQRLVKLEFEWSSSGLWQLPFPGSVQIGLCLSPESLDLPENLASAISCWHQDCDINARPWDDDDTFDYVAFDEKGLEPAKRLKLHLGESVYVEYHPFREIKIVGGEAVETDVPSFIRQLCISDES